MIQEHRCTGTYVNSKYIRRYVRGNSYILIRYHKDMDHFFLPFSLHDKALSLPHEYPCLQLPADLDHSNLAFPHGIVGGDALVREQPDGLVEVLEPVFIIVNLINH